MLELIIHRVQILHSLPVLYASLKCKLGSNSVGIAYSATKLASEH